MSMSQVGSGLPRLLAERYELSEQLASGGMTSVWRGHDRVLGRDVVVKVLHPELAADERFRARFHEEAVNAARLTHPNIVALYDTGEQGGVAYIVMELVHGPALGQVLARHGPLPPARAARLASEVCSALDYAHQTGVCHGSLKPSNILLADDGTVKVADFSIARAAADEDPSRTGEILGPDGFLAPEVVRGQQADWRADVYGLGACLYAMLTGRPPGFDPATTIPPRSVRAGVPRDLDAIVRQAMAPDPDDRFQTVQAVAAALARSAAAADGPPAGDLVGVPAEPPTLRGAPPPERGFGHEGRWLGWTLALIGLAAVLVVVGVTVAGDQLAGLLGLGRDPTTQTTEPPAQTTGPKALDATATSFDPFSTDAVKEENEDQARLAVDGNRGTAWRTEGYNDNLGGAFKQGVGLVLELNGSQTGGELTLTLPPGEGTQLTIYGADGERPGSLEGWGDPLAGPEAAAGRMKFDLGDNRYQYLLVWFTSLPRDGDRFRGGIVEARLTS
jgi:eukaryotic-like serine/threonine-protein kinase